MTPQALETYADAAAAALGLPLGAHRAEVLRYFALASSMADLVQAAPLGPLDESSMGFVPVEPQERA